MESIFRSNLVWLAMLASCALGCSPKGEKAAKAETKSKPAELISVRQPAPELEALAIKLTHDKKSGLISVVDCTGVVVDDTLASKIAGLSGCTKLTIDGSGMTDAGWASLASLMSLQQLDLRGCALTKSQLKAAVSGMPDLRALRLSGQNGLTNIEDDGLAVLSQCPKLKVLAADELFISEDGLKHLSNCPEMAELYLKGTLITDEALTLIAKMKNLRKLRLAKTKVSSVGLEALSSLSLEDLDVSECSRVLDDAMVPVGKMKTLKRLNLWRDVITDEGAAQLAGLTNLEWLNLDNTHLRDAGLDHLSGMTKLSFLHIGSTGVTDAGMSKLAPLLGLKDLKVTRTSVTEEGAAVVTKAIPDVSVQLKYIEGE